MIELSPESKKKQQEYQELGRYFSELFMLLKEMEEHTGPKLTATYQSLFGKLEYEDLSLFLSVRILSERKRLLQQYVNRDETPDLTDIEEKIAKFISLHQKLLDDKAEEIKRAKELLSLPKLTLEETKQMRKLYQTIVKATHPDLNPEAGESAIKVFHIATEAYQTGDLEKLTTLYQVLASKGLLDNVILDGMYANWDEKIEGLRKRIDKLAEQIAKLRLMFPFSHEEKLVDPEWVKQRELQLQESIQERMKEKEQLQEVISLLEEYRSQYLGRRIID